MPATFFYIMALWVYLAGACCVWFTALVLAFFPSSRLIAKKLAAGMALSFPGVFTFQILAAPVVLSALLLVMAVLWVAGPSYEGAGAPLILFFIPAFGLVAFASLCGFYLGWRVGWEWAAGGSPRSVLTNDRILGPILRFLGKRFGWFQP